jgi:RNA recognition motif-containing protein
MSFTVFLGNLPVWVTADDIRGWLSAENLVADAIKVIRNPETQESKGFAFIEAPNAEEMHSIIRRFDRAPLEDRLLRANPAQPPKSKGPPPSSSQGPGGRSGASGPPPAASSNPPASTSSASHASAAASFAGSPPQTQAAAFDRPRRAKKNGVKRSSSGGPQSAFAEELAKAL